MINEMNILSKKYKILLLSLKKLYKSLIN